MSNTGVLEAETNRAHPNQPYIDIVLGEPADNGDQTLIEIESPAGKGIHIGRKFRRSDGYWVIRIFELPWYVPEFKAVDDPPTANARQEGGNHYKDLPLEPWDLTVINALDPFQHEVCAYVIRHRDKNGIEDLKKARHWLDKYIEVIELHPKESPFIALRAVPRVALAILKAAVAKLERSL